MHILASPTATEKELLRLSTVRHVEIYLKGTLRTLWLEEVQLHERPLAALMLPPASPHSPPLPWTPPNPPSLPSPNCSVWSGLTFGLTPLDDGGDEPCGVDVDFCCSAASQREGAAFRLDGAGCCTVGTLVASDALPRIPSNSTELSMYGPLSFVGLVHSA